MKKIYIFLLAFMPLISLAQISITSNDLQHSGDFYTVSTGVAFSGMDATLTGANYNWDYSQLTYSSQTTDTIFDESSTGSLLSVFFVDFAFNVNRSNLASHGNSFAVGTVNVSDVWNFYYNSTSSFKQVGFGAIVNGAPLPVAYSPQDVIYNLPLTFGQTDSGNSGYALDLTSTLGLYYSIARTRSTEVDGWGSLTTPLGTFNVLRTKATVIEQDSVYIDSLGFGLNLPPVTTIEYKWLGAGSGIPLLEINTSGTGIVTSIKYQDTLNTTAVTSLAIVSEPVLFPNPASDYLFVKYNLSKPANVHIAIYSQEGKLVADEINSQDSAGDQFKSISLSQYHLAHGTYFLHLNVDGKEFTKAFQL